MIIPAVHKTDPASARSILEAGFDLGRFGTTTKKTGQAGMFGRHPKGVFLTVDDGFRAEDPASHPWDHRDRGVLVFCRVSMENPLRLHQRVDGKFYQEWLSDKYGGLSGSRLTAAIQADGHDGVLCEETGEVIAFDTDQVEVDRSRTEESLASYDRWRAETKGFREWLRG